MNNNMSNTCSYKSDEISTWWSTLTSRASYDECSLESWLRCMKNNPWGTCRVNLHSMFIGALKSFSKSSPSKKKCKKFVTKIFCDDLPFNGHLFISKTACKAIDDEKYSEVDMEFLSNCKCNCETSFNVYCNLGSSYSNSKYVGLVKALNSTECSTTSSTGSSKAGSSAQTTTSPLTSQIVTSQSEAPSVHDTPVSKSSISAAATIGGVVGGVVGLAVIALLLMMILIRRRKISRRENKSPDKQPTSGAFTNNAYHHTENMVESVNPHLNANKQIASDRQNSFHDYQHVGGNDEHEYAISSHNGKPDEYDYVKTTTALPSSTMTIASTVSDSGNYDLATPIQQNYFVLEPETQQNSAGNYFVLEKDNHENKADDRCGADNLYNSLNEKHKMEDNGGDEYHHLRDINKQAGLESGVSTKSDANNYDVLAKVSNYKVVSDDYDHCKPRKVSDCNQEDDYDHLN